MPIHDWTRVPSGLFHDFHQSWAVRIKETLNAGRLPPGLSALVEQRAGPVEPDVLAVEARPGSLPRVPAGANLATLPRPATRFVRRSDNESYARRANRIVVRQHLGRVVAVIEVVSPGNKDGRVPLRKFVDKTVDYLNAGVHVLIVDPFPPTKRDPSGVHKLIWDEVEADEDFALPEGKDRTLVSYEAVPLAWVAYIEPVGVGDELPDMPLFLAEEFYVPVPLESTYRATWDALPELLRHAVETGELPAPYPE